MKNKVARITFIAGLLFLFFIFSVQLVYSSEYINSDFFSFWLAGHMVWTGEDPYVASTWIQGHYQYGATWISDNTFLYPLPLSIIFSPLGLLKLDHAYIAWIFLSECVIGASIYTLSLLWKPPKISHLLIPTTIGLIFFRPVYMTLHNGQLGALFLLVITLVIYFWENDKWVQGSIFLPFLALKPQYGIPIIVFLILWLWLQKRKYTAVAAFSGSSILLIASGWIKNPLWINEFITIIRNKSEQTLGYNPTIWGVSGFICKHQLPCVFIFGGIASALLIILICYFILRVSNISPAFFIGIAVTTSLIITPYIWAYDLILLTLPILLVIIYLTNNDFPKIIATSVFPFFSAVALGLLVPAYRLAVDVWSTALPVLVLIGLMYFYLRRFPLNLTHPTSYKTNRHDLSI